MELEIRVTNRWNFFKTSVLMLAVFLTVLALKSSALAERQVYLGVFREGAPKNMNFIQQFEQQAGRKPAMIMWYQDWAQEFPRSDADNVIAYGAVPHIVWEPWYWSDHNKVKLRDISAGKWDAYIKSWARGAREFGQPIFIRMMHEFNMEGYPWGIVNNEKDPNSYIKAYRHVVDIFRREKADNVRWVWAPMNYSFPDEQWNDWPKAYPGSDYVDWVGFDGYNWGTTQNWSDWQVFKYLFREQVRKAKKLWPDKPVMVAEFASADQGGDKAAWIREIPAYLKTSMRDIDAIIWFDLKKEADWRINSTARSLAAFKEIMKDPIFTGSAAELGQFVRCPEKAVRNAALALKAGKPLKIDGQLGDWDLTAPLAMKDISFFKEGLVWGGQADLSGDVYLMYDEQNLYLAAKVTDRIPLVNGKERQDIWNGDAIEMVLSTDPGASAKRDSFATSDYQVGLGTGNGKENKPTIWNWQRRRTPQGSEIVVKKVDKPLGYVLEAKIPWNFFGSFVPSAGTKVGFDVALDDADNSGEREKQFIWNGDYYFYKDPSVWGVLEFK